MNNTPYEKFINFLLKHNIYNKNVMAYTRENTIFIDYSNKEYRSFISTVPVIGKDKRLKSIKSILPHINDDITILININEYVKALIYYQRLEKYFNINEEIEILPLFYERLFIAENPTEELQKYKENLETSIIEENEQKYIVALNSQEELQNHYQKGNTNIETLKTKSKKLSRKYQKEYIRSNKK